MKYRIRVNDEVIESLGVSILAQKGEDPGSIKIVLPDNYGEIILFQEDLMRLIEHFPEIKEKFK